MTREIKTYADICLEGPQKASVVELAKRLNLACRLLREIDEEIKQTGIKAGIEYDSKVLKLIEKLEAP